MGAETFKTKGSGDDIGTAFRHAVDAALYDNGHAGYTGTLAEKTGFVEIILPEGTDANEFADKLIKESDPRIDDKWGPAGAIKLPDQKDTWLFFGWASS